MDEAKFREMCQRLVDESDTTWRILLDVDMTPVVAAGRYKQLLSALVGSWEGRSLFGVALPEDRTVRVFMKGVVFNRVLWTLAHELGHAHHYAHIAESREWGNDTAERYANEYAVDLIRRSGYVANWE